MSENVIIEPYNEQWLEIYQKEAQQLKIIFGENCLSIHHIGSTRIVEILPPNLDTKLKQNFLQFIEKWLVSKCNDYDSRIVA